MLSSSSHSSRSVQKILQHWLAPLGDGLPSLYLVGGAVRDLLLNRPIRDIDLMTQASEALARRLAAVHDAAVVPFVNKVDAPCFRVVLRSNKEAFIDLVPIRGGCVTADLTRRDFTINAMALPVGPAGLLSGKAIDPLDGQADLDRKLVRVTGPQALSDDPLRIIRAVRFAAELGFTIDTDTLTAMRGAAPQLAKVATERIMHELLLILGQSYSASHIRCLDHIGALAVIFPEILPMKGCAQNRYHHLDVWEHCLAALENAEALLVASERHFGFAAARLRQNLAADDRLPLLKLALILHDVGKPGTRSVDPQSGQTLFRGHDQLGAAMLETIGRRLKLSTIDQTYLSQLVQGHMNLRSLSQPEVKPATVLAWFRGLGPNMLPLIVLSMADVLATRGPAATEAERNRHLAWSKTTVAAFYDHLQQRIAAHPLINGHDVAALGVAPGPLMGRILAAVQEAQDNQTIITREEALDLARRISGPTSLHR